MVTINKDGTADKQEQQQVTKLNNNGNSIPTGFSSKPFENLRKIVRVKENVDSFFKGLEPAMRASNAYWAKTKRREQVRIRKQLERVSSLREQVEKLVAKQKDIIQLDIGGKVYYTSKQTLQAVPSSMLAAMFSGDYAVEVDANGRYFFDRNGKLFEYVLGMFTKKI